MQFKSKLKLHYLQLWYDVLQQVGLKQVRKIKKNIRKHIGFHVDTILCSLYRFNFLVLYDRRHQGRIQRYCFTACCFHTCILLYCLFLFFIHLKQFPASNDEKYSSSWEINISKIVSFDNWASPILTSVTFYLCWNWLENVTLTTLTYVCIKCGEQRRFF